MRFGGILAVALLSISIMSYGISGNALADSHNIPPISTSTNLPSYQDGDRVNLSGSIKNYDADDDAGKDVIIKILSPNGNLVGIGQVSPESDGTFSYSFVAGGPNWKTGGDYIIESFFNSNASETVVVYVKSEPVVVTCGPDEEMVNGECIAKPPPPPPVTCGPDEEMVNGECIAKPPPPPPTCEDGQELRNGVCVDVTPMLECGPGTENVDGQCVPITTPPTDDDDDARGGSCLIATAAFGSELAPQVQSLREIRDGVVLSTSSGTAFMTGFNQMYYSFSPAVADLERENPAFKEVVRAFITPMISSLSIMTLADPGSEIEVLGFGISIIMLNLGLYIAAPAIVGFKVCRHFKSQRN